MRKKNSKEPIEVHIERLTSKGNGKGHAPLRTLPVEVPFTLPHEKVLAQPLRNKKGVAKATLLTVVQPSSDRIAPRCPHFGDCGGCRLQHLPYPKQLAFKQQLIEEATERELGLRGAVKPIIGAQQSWCYRNKMEYTFSTDKNGNRYLGLIKDSTRGKVINIESCYLVDEWFCKALEVVRQWWAESGLDAYRPMSDSGTLRTLTLRHSLSTGDRMAILTVSGRPEYAPNKKSIDRFVELLRTTIEPSKGALSIFLIIQQAIKGSPTNFYEMLLYGPDHIKEEMTIKGVDRLSTEKNFSFQVSPSAFFQPNTAMASCIYSSALQLAKLDQESVVYDLYCGTGTIAICFAPFVKRVVGIELSAEAILDAKENMKINCLDNLGFYCGNAGDVLKQIREKQQEPMPDLICIDPPRTGLTLEAIEQVVSTEASQIIYISCNYQTQLRDLLLFETKGYQIVSLQPIDCFPHTYHVECVAYLKKGEQL